MRHKTVYPCRPSSLRKCIGALVMAVGAACSFHSAARAADADTGWAQCSGEVEVPEETQLAACSAVIDAGRVGKPELAEAYVTRCEILRDQEQPDAAERDCDRALELNPDSPSAHNARGKLYSEREQFELAITEYTESLRLKADYAQPMYLRGEAYMRTGDYDRAIRDFKDVQILSPYYFGNFAGGFLEQVEAAKVRIAAGQKLGDAHAWCEGKALPQESGGFPQFLILEGCTKVIESGTEPQEGLVKAYLKRGFSYLFMDESADHLARAIADYRHAIELDPQNADAFVDLGDAYSLSGDHDGAIDSFTAAIAHGANNAYTFVERGEEYYAKGDFDRALADYDEALRLTPDAADVLVLRSLAYNGKGDHDRALADCTQAIKFSVTSEATTGHHSCGVARFHQGDFDAARAEFEQALELWPEYPEALYGRGVVKLRQGDSAGGTADIAAARKLRADVETVEAALGLKP